MSDFAFIVWLYAAFAATLLATTAEPGSWLDRAWRATAAPFRSLAGWVQERASKHKASKPAADDGPGKRRDVEDTFRKNVEPVFRPAIHVDSMWINDVDGHLWRCRDGKWIPVPDEELEKLERDAGKRRT